MTAAVLLTIELLSAISLSLTMIQNTISVFFDGVHRSCILEVENPDIIQNYLKWRFSIPLIIKGLSKNNFGFYSDERPKI